MKTTKLFDKIDIINKCIDNGDSIVIEYRNDNKGQITERTIMPIKYTDGHNVLAFDGLRKNYRKFSMENIIWVNNREL